MTPCLPRFKVDEYFAPTLFFTIRYYILYITKNPKKTPVYFMATNIDILRPLAERLLKLVRSRFRKEAIKRDIPIPDDEDRFWGMIDPDTKEPLFNVVIGRGLRSSTFYKKITYEKPKSLFVDETNVDERIEYWGWSLRDETLELFMRFLQCPGGNVIEQFRYFCDTRYDEEKDNELVKESDVNIQFNRLWANLPAIVNRLKKPVRTDIKDVIRMRADYLRITYAPLFQNTSWWIYFYGYDKLNLKRNKGTWNLIKLLFNFGDINEEELSVTIDNTNTPEHYDYVGSTDFANSQPELLVFNFVTDPHYTRQLNIKIHVGIGEGKLFLGQYLNYENDGYIISGTIILEDASGVPISQRKPKVHYVPQIEAGDRYTEPFEGVSQYILDYLHDKEKNFRRTPLRAGHSMRGLQEWLETRHDESGTNLSNT